MFLSAQNCSVSLLGYLGSTQAHLDGRGGNHVKGHPPPSSDTDMNLHWARYSSVFFFL